VISNIQFATKDAKKRRSCY